MAAFILEPVSPPVFADKVPRQHPVMFADGRSRMFFLALCDVTHACFDELYTIVFSQQGRACDRMQNFQSGLDVIAQWGDDVKLEEGERAVSIFPDILSMYSESVEKYAKLAQHAGGAVQPVIRVHMPKLYAFLYALTCNMAASKVMRRGDFFRLRDRAAFTLEMVLKTMQETIRILTTQGSVPAMALGVSVHGAPAGGGGSSMSGESVASRRSQCYSRTSCGTA